MTELTKAEAAAFTEKNRARARRYQPGWKLSTIITWPGSSTGKDRCWGETSDHSGMITHWCQCDKVGKIKLADGSTWCGTHSPEAVGRRAAKRAELDAQREAESAARRAAWREEARRKVAFDRFLAALRSIEAGCNDARTEAREALGDYLEPPAE